MGWLWGEGKACKKEQCKGKQTNIITNSFCFIVRCTLSSLGPQSLSLNRNYIALKFFLKNMFFFKNKVILGKGKFPTSHKTGEVAESQVAKSHSIFDQEVTRAGCILVNFYPILV